MNQEQLQKWEDYCLAEKDRIRSVLLEKLSSFISSVTALDKSQYEEWVYELSRNIVDKEESFPIRVPLFEKVIFPILFEGYKIGKPDCARWLAGFDQLIYKSKLAKESLGKEFTQAHLLENALRHDPQDKLAKRKLVYTLASRLEYVIHEVPWGVLWDMNGANADQCELLKDELAEFISLAKDCGLETNYEDLITECQLHFNEYQSYLRECDKWETYEAYLLSRGIHA